MNILFLTVAFCVAATIYGSAGFGGGSAYLALLALAAVPSRSAAVVALLCNVVVVARTSLTATRIREIDWRGFAAFAWVSVPAAVLGASYRLEQRHLDWILATTLLGSALALASPKRAVEPSQVRERTVARRIAIGFLLGAPLGLLGGMVGIGGGVFLSPILHFLRWNSSKRIATLCSVFILANSLAGLVGKRAEFAAIEQVPFWWLLPLAVLIGGSFGARLLLRRLSNVWITRATAVVVFLASLQTFLRALH
jgi:uncharacterized membrane protein YfcA